MERIARRIARHADITVHKRISRALFHARTVVRLRLADRAIVLGRAAARSDALWVTRAADRGHLPADQLLARIVRIRVGWAAVEAFSFASLQQHGKPVANVAVFGPAPAARPALQA